LKELQQRWGAGDGLERMQLIKQSRFSASEVSLAALDFITEEITGRHA